MASMSTMRPLVKISHSLAKAHLRSIDRQCRLRGVRRSDLVSCGLSRIPGMAVLMVSVYDWP